MASTARSYLDSGDLRSANFAPAPPSPLVRRIEASRLRGYIGQRVGRKYLDPLRETLKSFVIVSKQGPDFHASTFGVSIQTGRSYRTVQRHIDRLCELKVLKLKRQANEFINGSIRRTATYVLHEEAGIYLAPSETYAEWKARNRRSSVPRRKGPQRVITAPTETPITASEVAQMGQPFPREHRTNNRSLPTLTPRQRKELVRRIPIYMQGVTRISETQGGYGYDLAKEDPRYSSPLGKSEAILAACKSMCETDGVSLDKAIEAAADAGFVIESQGDA